MKKIFIVIMCIFLFGCNKENENINTTSKKVNIQKKSYYAFKVKTDDDISYNVDDGLDGDKISYNTSNNLEEKEEIIEEVVEGEDNIIENISDEEKENLDNNEIESNDSNNLDDKNSYDVKQEDVIISNDKEKEDNSNSKDIRLMTAETSYVIEDDSISNNEIVSEKIEEKDEKTDTTEEKKEDIKEEIKPSEEEKVPNIEEKKGYYSTLGTYLGDTKVKVIDISYHQGIIDFDSFVNSDLYYGVILRVGYYNTMDKLFERNINEIKRLNIPYGIYLFSYSTNSSESLIEAEFTNSMIDKYDLKPKLGIYYDIESWNTKRKSSDNISKETYDSMVSSYINSVSNHVNNNYKVKVYSNRWYAMNRLGSKSKAFVDWVAEYNKTCKYDAPYSMWQYTSKGSVPGIKGNVDISYLY